MFSFFEVIAIRSAYFSLDKKSKLKFIKECAKLHNVKMFNIRELVNSRSSTLIMRTYTNEIFNIYVEYLSFQRRRYNSPIVRPHTQTFFQFFGLNMTKHLIYSTFFKYVKQRINLINSFDVPEDTLFFLNKIFERKNKINNKYFSLVLNLERDDTSESIDLTCNEKFEDIENNIVEENPIEENPIEENPIEENPIEEYHTTQEQEAYTFLRNWDEIFSNNELHSNYSKHSGLLDI